MPIMAPAQKMELLMMIYRAIFPENGVIGADNSTSTIRERFKAWALQVEPRMFKDSSTRKQTIPGMDIILDIGETHPNGTLKPKNIRCISQNPNKRDRNGNLSQTAILARAGHTIMWVIDQDLENGFLGSIQDGRWAPSRPRAVYPAKPAETAIDQSGTAYQIDEGEWIHQIPPMDKNNIAEAITEYFDFEDDEERTNYGAY